MISRASELCSRETPRRVQGQIWLCLGRMYLEGCGTEKNAVRSLNCYRKARQLFYELTEHGREEYRESLEEVARGEDLAQEEPRKNPPRKYREFFQ